MHVLSPFHMHFWLSFKSLDSAGRRPLSDLKGVLHTLDELGSQICSCGHVCQHILSAEMLITFA